MGPEAALTIGIFAFVIVLVGIYVLRRMPRGKVAEVAVGPGESFELRAAPADARSYKIWARYDMAWTGTQHDNGLSFRFEATVDGAVVLDRFIGLGRMTMDDPGDYIDPTPMLARSSRSPSGYSEAATIQVFDLGPRVAGSELVVRGSVVPSQGTTLAAVTVFLAR